MKRRDFLAAAFGTYALGTLDWMRFFGRNGVPGTGRSLALAEAAAQAAGQPRFLIYWFLEGGWDGYSMFNPVATRNDAAGAATGAPADQIYRPNVPLVNGLYPVTTQGNIQFGHLAASGASLLKDMAVVSSHRGGTFHSGSRLQYHMGIYDMAFSGKREADERSVTQAFAEAHGASYFMPHISWHNWLADGELAPSDYPEGTGYYEKLGPSYAHTIYGNTPTVMRQRIAQVAAASGSGRDAAIHKFVDNLHQSFLKDRNSQSVKAFAAAVQAHKALVSGGSVLDPATLFTDPKLRAEFNIQSDDEKTSATSVNGNAARSKNAPRTNVQAMMTYELMTKGASNTFWIESSDVRGFDTHNNRANVLRSHGQTDQKSRMDRDLWAPLNALVARLKSTPYGTGGQSYFDLTTIVLASEMGRSMGGGDDDVCQHWNPSSVCFLGGSVKGGTQFGRIGTASLDSIPTMPDGSLDPAYDATTGLMKSGATKSPASFVSDAGSVYATALDLSGISKANQKGRNKGTPLAFVKK
jgi:uncharacterized protein (DUF1501 family)